jgi:hypothetical protein
MSLFTRKTTVFAHLESVYATAVALVAADAIRTHGAKLKYVDNGIKRDLDGQSMGNTGKTHVGAHWELEFDVEIAGSGVAGTAPNYGPLFKASKMSEVVVADTSVTYARASGSTDSLTMYFQLDGQRRAMRGARGTWQIKIDSQGIPYLHFKFIGLWVAPQTIADIVPDFTGFLKPKPVAFEYTPKVSLFGLDSVYKSFSADFGNDCQYINNPGEELVEVVDGSATGSVMLLAPAFSTHDYFSDARANTEGALTLVHGMTAGNIFTFNAPQTQLDGPDDDADQGRAFLKSNLDFNLDDDGTADSDLTLVYT